MENLKIFENKEFGSIRTVEFDGAPWFVGKDIAEVLGYARTADAIRVHVDDEDKGVCKTPTPSGDQNMTIINESGLYSLIISSKLPTAKQFKRWVTSEVLPSIRKTGSYSVQPKFQVPTTFAEALRLAADQQEQIEQQAKQLETQKPKVLFADAVETSQRSCLVAELAKILKQNGVDTGQNRLFKWLRGNGYLGNKGEYYNQPTQKAMDMGLFELKKRTVNNPDGTVMVVTTTKVTPKGQIYFVNKLIEK